MNLTVADLIKLANTAKKEVKAGRLSLNSELYISLEVCKDGDEDTYENRLHGGSIIEVGVTACSDGSRYVHIQLEGNPNFKVYP